MKVVINGFEEEVKAGLILADLIVQLREQSSSLIVEVNGRFVYPKDYGTYEIRPGDRIEMIHPAFGG
ncbi:MAG: sulfur carrier protein ThiS [Thermodesulfobacteriota bacterium]